LDFTAEMTNDVNRFKLLNEKAREKKNERNGERKNQNMKISICKRERIDVRFFMFCFALSFT